MKPIRLVAGILAAVAALAVTAPKASAKTNHYSLAIAAHAANVTTAQHLAYATYNAAGQQQYNATAADDGAFDKAWNVSSTTMKAANTKTAANSAKTFNVAARAAPAVVSQNNMLTVDNATTTVIRGSPAYTTSNNASAADNSISTAARAAPALKNSANATARTAGYHIFLGFASSAKLASNAGGADFVGYRKATTASSVKFAKKTSPAARVAGG